MSCCAVPGLDNIKVKIVSEDPASCKISFEPDGMSKCLNIRTRSASLQEAGQSEIEMLEHGPILHIWN